jgi:N-carbamoylputrescine amidase
LEFWGQSFIVSPDGQIVSKGSTDQEEIISANIDLAKVDFSRTHWPFLRDRRIDAYGNLSKRFVDAT